MPGPGNHPEDRKAVGIYDRPAKADRTRLRPVWLVALAAVAIVAAVVLYLLNR